MIWRTKALVFLTIVVLAMVLPLAKADDWHFPPGTTISIPAGTTWHLGDDWVSTTGTAAHITDWFSTSWVNITVDNAGTQQVYIYSAAISGQLPTEVYIDGVLKAVNFGWTYALGISTITTATASISMKFSLTSTVTIQAKNSAGVNLPRAVIITMTFPNASKASFTSTSTGLTTISNVPVGVNHYTVWWGAILVSSSISLTVTGITSTSITTTVQQLTDGSYYALFALNNTVIVPISYQSKDDLIWPGQTAPSSPVFKADVANWRSSGQPTTFRTGAWLIDRSLSSWTWSNGILQCGTSFTVSTADMELLWATVVDPSWPPAPTTPTTPTTPPVDNGTSILVPSSTNPTGVIPQDTTTTTQPRLSVDTTTLGIVIVGIIACVVIAIGYLSKHANNASLWTKKKSPRAKDGKVAKKFKKRGKR